MTGATKTIVVRDRGGCGCITVALAIVGFLYLIGVLG